MRIVPLAGVLISVISCGLFPRNAWAALPLPEVLNRMEAQQQSIQDLNFKFVERIQAGGLPDQRTVGEVQFKSPHSLRVTQKTPEKQILVSDGTTFWLYSPIQQQQLTGSWSAWVKQSHFPLPLIDWAGTLTPERWRSRYTVYYGGFHDRIYELRFQPKQAGDVPITLWVSEKTFLPVGGRMDQAGSTIQITLQDMKLNPGLAASVFQLHVPAGTPTIPVQF
jgi:outer membrane lipoprotein-sorting protein